MECKQIKLWLSYYLLDELDERTRSRVEAHLEECADCRQALEDMKYYQSVLRQVDEIKSPEDLREKILGRVSHENIRLRIPFNQTVFYNIGRYAAAVVLILAILLIPGIRQQAQMEITYSKKVVKRGKGSPDVRGEAGEVRLIREMAEISNGELVHVQTNEITKLVDYIDIRIPRADFKHFADRYNQEDIFEILPAEPPAGRS